MSGASRRWGSQLAPGGHRRRLRDQGLEVEPPVLTGVGCVTLGSYILQCSFYKMSIILAYTPEL